jgi:uncharacterized LabA/DUF88 family protein
VSRVVAYVDGFNLYWGMKARTGRKYLWLDLEMLARTLLRPGQRLEAVRYFTAPVRNDPAALGRQYTYLTALRAHTPAIEVVLGRYQEKTFRCNTCGALGRTYEEKETDVSIAVALLEDGVNNRFDTALVISADSDLCPAIRALNRLRPALRVVAAFPPKRHSDDRAHICNGVRHISVASLRSAQLPDSVTAPSGRTFKRPTHWI